MSYRAPAPLSESDGTELLRIARVCAKEWVRSGRRPPGSPHRATLLAPSAAWLRITIAGEPRDAVQLSSARPLWETVAQLAAELVGVHPSPTTEQLAVSRIALLVLGEPAPLAGPFTDALLDEVRGHHLAVSNGRRARLVPVEAAVDLATDAAARLDRACRSLGLDRGAWRALEVSAFPAGDVPIVSS